jgi:hypothetical protein
MNERSKVHAPQSIDSSARFSMHFFARPVRDHFPMRNPATGQEVTCYSGEYWYEESSYDLKIAEQCISACERYRFRRVSVNDYYKPNPKIPDEDMKQFIPAACLP